METLSTARRTVVKDLTRTRHMGAVSAVVLGTIFLPLLGMPDIYEVPAFHNAMDRMSGVRAAVRDDEAARQRMLVSVTGEENQDQSFWRAASDRPPVVRRIGVRTPDQEMLVAMIAPEAAAEPLPTVAEPQDVVIADEEEALADEDEIEPVLDVEEPIEDEEVALDEEY
jgi:hypothetical protein